MEDNLSTRPYDDNIDIKRLLSVLWADRVMIISVTILFAIGSVLIAISIPNQYKATAVLAPAQSDGGGLSSALGQLGGLASLAGVTIGEASSSDSQIAQRIMKSWSFIDAFIADNNLEVEVYAVKGWNAGSGELQIDEKIFDEVENLWLLEDDDTGALRSPSSWELYEVFREMLSVSQDKQSGLVTVSVEYFSPEAAKRWTDLYIKAINKHMQTRQVAKVTNNINYLEDQIAKTSIAEMREVFYTIIEEQTKNKMVAEASPDYAFVTVSPSMLPEEESKPRRALICVLGTILGGMLAVLTAFVRNYMRSAGQGEAA